MESFKNCPVLHFRMESEPPTIHGKAHHGVDPDDHVAVEGSGEEFKQKMDDFIKELAVKMHGKLNLTLFLRSS